ncbi:MAG: Re/Si-specific NAD(P)(+) transhydrogenase subunit alpha [Magnetococcus sp. DMHC-1]|nr:Re/Si-specific NAD(P)(+) transhydrogenase subunit alpha [Magnetococcales bacterium]
MKIGIPKEIHPGEKRVAATPDSVVQLGKLGFTVLVEAGAGDEAKFTNQSYQNAGAEIVPDAKSLWAAADIVLKVRAPIQHTRLKRHEADLLREGATLISFIWPAQNKELLDRLAARKATVIAMDAVPRISRAQKMDALSSMANIGGYRGVIEAANQFGRFFTGQITAAGKMPPALVMVIGAGVAGLAAIGAAGSLGAVVRAFDTRPEVKEQIQSMGAEFLELDFEEDGTGAGGYAKVMSEAFIKAEMELFAQQAKEVDIIITTALIPGKPAPVLITADMVKSMREGSVIVDMAAENGGNCELTEPGKIVVKHGVTIIGFTDLPSRLPTQASQLYATNLRHLISDMCKKKDGQLHFDMEDDVVRSSTVVHNGEITWPPPPLKTPVSAQPQVGKAPLRPAPVKHEPTPEEIEQVKKEKNKSIAMAMGGGALALLAIGASAPPAFLSHLIVFVLAIFVGYQVVWNVTPSLHTPLMSVTNAISGIIIIGALLEISGPPGSMVTFLASVSVLIAMINVAGGFLVTHRMLKMFRR